MGALPGHQRCGRCHQPHIVRGHIARQIHHATGQGHGGEKRKFAAIGLVLGKIHEPHTRGLQKHLHHEGFRRRCKYQCIQLARQKGHRGGCLLQPGQFHLPFLHAVRIEQSVYQGGHAAAFRAHVHAQAPQLAQTVEPSAVSHFQAGIRTIEQPDRLDKKAAQRHQEIRVVRLQLCGAALHKGQIGLALAQQLQVGR